MKQHLSLLVSLLATPGLLADTAEAGKLLRQGDAVAALQALQTESGPEAEFWRGRTLIELGRLQEACKHLLSVPPDHELYPYAAKALLYCAWQNNSVDFAVIATPLATSNNQEIATLATAALAEYWLHKPHSQDNSALGRLRDLAANQPELQPVLRLLEIDNFRQKGEYDQAIEQCRAIENDRNLPMIMRHRARLALAEVYYTKEAAKKPETRPATEFSLIGSDETTDEHFDDGKGEETLLHFISSHPDSPLLEEAFRRLSKHEAFEKSEYARTKLREWITDPLKSRRAAQALLIQQHLLNPEGATEAPLDVTCANTAAATCPNEAATHSILLEQVRMYLERGQRHEAALYLGMMQGEDERKVFYEIQLSEEGCAEAARKYIEFAQRAAEPFRSTALVNALVCALKSGDTEAQNMLFSIPDLTEAQHHRLVMVRSAYWLKNNPDKARSDIAILQAESGLDKNLKADAEMDYAYLEMQNNPGIARDILERSSINQHLVELSSDRQLRFFSLQEEALRRMSGESGGTVPDEVMELIHGAAGKVREPQVVATLTLHLASLHSAKGEHEAAMRTLQALTRKYPKGDFVPRSLYMSARECEFIATHDSLRRAIELYTSCAEKSEELATKATIRLAAVHLRLGNHVEMEHALTRLWRERPDMRPEDKALANAVMANSKALLGTPEGRLEAIEIASKAINDMELPRWWRFRALLHRATLCARADKNEDALRDYEEVLSMFGEDDKMYSDAEWHILYSAGSGAVLQLLQLKRYPEAAAMADRIGNWNKKHADSAKHKQFTDWADFIRQTNFVNNPSIPF